MARKGKDEKNIKIKEEINKEEIIQKELEKYLKITEGEIKIQKEKEEFKKKNLKIFDEKLEILKNLKSKETYEIDESFNLLYESVK